MAYRAGARCINLQYIQFHPTALLAPDGCFLISETVRGEGGRLVDRHGKEFMQRFHPAGSLAPRDVAARAIYRRCSNQGLASTSTSRHKPAVPAFASGFPSIYLRAAWSADRTLTSRTHPRCPAPHYSCGGIATDDFGGPPSIA